MYVWMCFKQGAFSERFFVLFSCDHICYPALNLPTHPPENVTVKQKRNHGKPKTTPKTVIVGAADHPPTHTDHACELNVNKRAFFCCRVMAGVKWVGGSKWEPRNIEIIEMLN